MRQFLICVIPIACMAIQAQGAAYVAQVLYPLSPPAGFSSDSFNVVAYPGATVGTQTVGYATTTATNAEHAVLFSAPAGAAVDLNPTLLTGFSTSEAFTTSGLQQVGSGYGSGTGNVAHALLWSGTAASAVDLNPTQLGVGPASVAYGVGGGQQVGTVGFDTGHDTAVGHAVLWSGTAASAVDLNPATASNSEAFGTDGIHQVGDAGGNATLWTGTAASAVNLNPTGLSGITISRAFAVGGNEQVGIGEDGPTTYSAQDYALLWTGTAASAVDLNPFNGYSEAFGTNGTQQVGEASGATFSNHAVVWSGTAASAVDLNALLPTGPSVFFSSEAFSIDSLGDVFGIGGAVNSSSGAITYSAVEWTALPEPASLWLIGCGAMLIRRRRT